MTITYHPNTDRVYLEAVTIPDAMTLGILAAKLKTTAYVTADATGDPDQLAKLNVTMHELLKLATSV